MTDITYSVPGMSCGHCERAVREELLEVDGVTSVDVDLDVKTVVVRGERLDDPTLKSAIGSKE